MTRMGMVLPGGGGSLVGVVVAEKGFLSDYESQEYGILTFS